MTKVSYETYDLCHKSGNITRLKELKFIMFFKESLQDKAKKSQLICVKSFTLRIRFHLNLFRWQRKQRIGVHDVLVVQSRGIKTLCCG